MIFQNKILPVICLPIGLAMDLVGAGLIPRKRVLGWVGASVFAEHGIGP